MDEELVVNYPVDEEEFEKNGGAKDFDFKQKNQFEKKNRGSSRVEGSGLQLGIIPYIFWPPEKF